MAQPVTLQKQVYDKNQYQKVIDTSFTQLVQPTTVFTGLYFQQLVNFLMTIINYFLIYPNLEKQTLMSIL